MAYLLLSIEMFLATYTLARFKIAYGGLGGTELRIALALVNVAVFLWPGPLPLGVRLFDVAGVAATAALAARLYGLGGPERDPAAGRGNAASTVTATVSHNTARGSA